jgi:DnaJ-class molecular chaperone
MYDQFGFDGPQGFGGGQGGGYYSYGSGFDGFGGFSDFGDFGDLGDIFSSFIGGGAGRSRTSTGPSRGSDLKMNLDITFEEAYLYSKERVEEIVSYLSEGKSVAVISDAGHILIAVLNLSETFQNRRGN